MSANLSGIGMTSQRTRVRMVERLRSQGIKDEVVLDAMASVPRHIFVDEALSTRAYEDCSLPIGFGIVDAMNVSGVSIGAGCSTTTTTFR